MTFSLIAHDANNQQSVAAVASHYAAIGDFVPWVSNLGAVAAQGQIDTTTGPSLLALVDSRVQPFEVLAGVLADPSLAELRQAAAVTGDGAAAHTGPGCMRAAGHVTRQHGTLRFSAQGNVVVSQEVWHTLTSVFADNDDLALPERAVTALRAGNEVGGDRRGELAAALVAFEPPWGTWSVRIDASETAVSDLGDVLEIHRAWQQTETACGLLAEGEPDEFDPEQAARAVELLTGAAEASRGNHEVLAYLAAAHAAAGDLDAAQEALERGGREFGMELLQLVHASGWFSVHPALRNGE